MFRESFAYCNYDCSWNIVADRFYHILHLSNVRYLAILGVLTLRLFGQTESVATIVERSAETNNRDFKAESDFGYKQTEKVPSGSRTSQVMLIDGTPYQRLIEMNGEPLSAQQQAVEARKQASVVSQRKNQNASARQSRIAKYERGQERDNLMISQLSKAFDFGLEREDKLNGFDVWVLKATPKAGYQPPTMQAQVLPGMQGELWIDKKTYEWVKVVAQVIRPVSIEGFLAVVEPGTEFEIEKKPVSGDIWQITHYSSRANARVLHLFNHKEQDDVTFFDFQPEKPDSQQAKVGRLQ